MRFLNPNRGFFASTDRCKSLDLHFDGDRSGLHLSYYMVWNTQGLLVSLHESLLKSQDQFFFETLATLIAYSTI